MTGNKQAVIIVVGVLLLWYFFIFAVALYARKESSEGFSKPKKYDERQLADRIKGMKYGFLTMLGYQVLWMILELAGVVLWVSAFGAALGVVLGGGVFSVFCILNDALYHPGEKNRWVPPLLINLGLFNVGIRAIAYKGDELFSNGVLTAKASLFLLLFYLLVFDVALLLRKAVEKREM